MREKERNQSKIVFEFLPAHVYVACSSWQNIVKVIDRHGFMTNISKNTALNIE